MHKVIGLSLAIGLAVSAMSVNRAEAAFCKTLAGEMVGFGEQSTRSEAESALSKAIAAWEERSHLKAKPKDRKMVCKDYIKLLNEFECKATAVVCR